MKYDLIIGIDPGVSGVVTTFYKSQVKIYPMPRTKEGMEKLFSHLSSVSLDSICFIEKLVLRPDDMKNIGRAFQLQKMFNHYEQLKTSLFYHKIRYICVMPRTWQKGMNLVIPKKEEYADRKRRFKEAAKPLFKMIRVTLKNCDGLLILNYGYNLLRYEPQKVEILLNSTGNNNIIEKLL